MVIQYLLENVYWLDFYLFQKQPFPTVDISNLYKPHLVLNELTYLEKLPSYHLEFSHMFPDCIQSIYVFGFVYLKAATGILLKCLLSRL